MGMGIAHNLSFLDPPNSSKMILQVPAVHAVAQTRDVEIVTRIQICRRSATAASFLFPSSRAPAAARASWSISTTITVPGRFFCTTNVGCDYVRRDTNTTFTVGWGYVGLPGWCERLVRSDLVNVRVVQGEWMAGTGGKG